MTSGEEKKTSKSSTLEVGELRFTSYASVSPLVTKKRIPVDRIIIRDRLREPTQAAKENLAVSFREAGQLQDILVRPAHVDRDGEWYLLVVGATRVGAAQICGWTDIGAQVREMSDDEACLAEIDENIVRPGLTPFERAVFVEERLKVWARLNPARVVAAEKVANISTFPTPKRGRPANSVKLTEFIGDTPPNMGFNVQTADELGLSLSTVERALRIAKGLSPAARAKVAGTKIAKNEGLLRQLAGVADREEQLKVVELLVDEKAKSFGDALVMANGRQPAPPPPPRPVDETVNAFMAIWKKAPPTHRAAILHALAGQSLPKGWTVTERADG